VRYYSDELKYDRKSRRDLRRKDHTDPKVKIRRLLPKPGRGSFLKVTGPALSWAMRRSADRFMSQTAQFQALSERTLDRILTQNRGTEFARRCGLDTRAPRRVFETLPVTTYPDYAPYIERIAAGEQNLLSGDSVVYFSNTSGTTGRPKMIPVTRRQMRLGVTTKLTAIGLALRAGVLKPMRGRFMTIMIDHWNPPTEGGQQTGSATTGGFQKLAPINDLIMTSPSDVSHIAEQTASRYLHLLFGLREERLWTIIAFFPATILFAMRDLHTHAEQLLRDLADGTIDPELELPAETRTRLLQRLRPQPDRARALADLLEHERFTVPHIWPDVGAIMTATGGAFHFYTDQLQPFLSGVRIFSPVYAASEGMIGYGFSADRPHYLLLPTLAYTEFVPLEEINDPLARPIAPWQAEPGRSYEVVVTTLAGFVRYRLHDIVRVLEFRGQNPIIEFVEREGQVISVASEKTAEHHIVEAIDTASHLVDESLVDYFVAPDTEQNPGCYVLAIEEWQSDCDNQQKVRAFLRAVEAALCKVAPFYEEERHLGTLGPMEALLLKPGAFERHRNYLIAAGGSASQIKTPHAIPDPGFVRHHFQHEVLSRVEA
jgi:hypothetical protein